ncbi:hypothetical protein FQR65_LT14400 [Abscondita terminalis]|nr:hypothetical protein FQR65_LT14400 [Abscondita terminalis]
MVFTQGQQNDIKEIAIKSFSDNFEDEKFLDVIATKLSNMVMAKIEDKLQQLENDELSKAFDDLQQYTRRNSIRIFGLKEDRNENVDQAVISLFNDKLGVQLSVDNIDRCHRLGVVQPGVKKPRAVIVQFTSYRYRAKVFKEKKKLKGSGITIREELTRARLELLNKSCEKFGFKNVWSNDGVIIVNKNNRKTRIKSMHDLEIFGK